MCRHGMESAPIDQREGRSVSARPAARQAERNTFLWTTDKLRLRSEVITSTQNSAEMLRALQSCRAAAATCGGVWARLTPDKAAAMAVDGFTIASDSRRLASTTAAASAGPLAAWHRRFEGVAPGSVLRIDLPHTAADVSLRVGEHEAVEVSSSVSHLEAEHTPHSGHPGSSLGEGTNRQRCRCPCDGRAGPHSST